MEAVARATAEDGVQLGENAGPGSKVCEEARKCAAWTPAVRELKVGTRYKKMIKMEGSSWAQTSSAFTPATFVCVRSSTSLLMHKVSNPGNQSLWVPILRDARAACLPRVPAHLPVDAP